MRFTSLTTPLLLLLLPLLTSAGGPPSCTLTCVHRGIEKANCGTPDDVGKRMGDHLGCLCNDPGFKQELENCIAQSTECENAEEVEAAKAAAVVVCDGFEL